MTEVLTMGLIDADALWERLNDEPWYNNADRDEIALATVKVRRTSRGTPNEIQQ